MCCIFALTAPKFFVCYLFSLGNTGLLQELEVDNTEIMLHLTCKTRQDKTILYFVEIHDL